jgi:hypothetical protein
MWLLGLSQVVRELRLMDGQSGYRFVLVWTLIVMVLGLASEWGQMGLVMFSKILNFLNR